MNLNHVSPTSWTTSPSTSIEYQIKDSIGHKVDTLLSVQISRRDLKYKYRYSLEIKMKTVVCAYCKTNFIKSDYLEKRSNLHFCNKKCSNLWRKSQQKENSKIKCHNCEKLFYRLPKNKSSKSKHYFCSISCAATYNNTHKTKGTRVSKLELYIQEKLKESYEFNFHFNRKDTINSELDIYIPELKLAFELNGVFHYEPIFGEEKLDKIQNNDNRKFQACLEKQIELCIIDTSWIRYNKESNFQKILDIIVKIISYSRRGLNPQTPT